MGSSQHAAIAHTFDALMRRGWRQRNLRGDLFDGKPSILLQQAQNGDIHPVESGFGVRNPKNIRSIVRHTEDNIEYHRKFQMKLGIRLLPNVLLRAHQVTGRPRARSDRCGGDCPHRRMINHGISSMTIADVTLAVFTFFNSLRFLAYVPQIAKAIKDQSGAEAISFGTWGLFLASHASAMAYAIENQG